MRIIKKFKNGVHNLFFFMDFFLWFVCINKIRKNNSKDNKDYNWATGIYDVYVLRKLIKKNKPKKNPRIRTRYRSVIRSHNR